MSVPSSPQGAPPATPQAGFCLSHAHLSFLGSQGSPKRQLGQAPLTSATSSKYTYSYEEKFYKPEKVSTARALEIV